VVDPEWLARELAAPSARAGVALVPALVAALARFAGLLLAWNRRINLTGARDAPALAEHLADALFLLPHLPAGPARVVDVGSGAGLPGVVVALARPDLEVVLLEPARKKQAFLRTALRTLGVAHARALAQSLEAHRAAPDFAPYDAALSRATWPLATWLALGAQIVGPGGRVLGLEGAEPAVLPTGAERHPYTVAGHRRAVVVQRA
jgi:16S rRNA (guanine527-N7)-methyltransferase